MDVILFFFMLVYTVYKSILSLSLFFKIIFLIIFVFDYVIFPG